MRTCPVRVDKQSTDKSSFAVGVVSGNNKNVTYELFRSYHTSSGSTNNLSGPEPGKCRIPEIFAAAGAAKFFLGPYKIAGTTYYDESFPQSHPVSRLALDEAIHLYGQRVDVSVLLNIGPGIPSEGDCRELDLMALSPIGRLVKRFSWPTHKNLSLAQKLLSFGTTQSPAAEELSRAPNWSEQVVQVENQRRDDVRARLRDLYGSDGASDRYHHLGPDFSAERASLNDVKALGVTHAKSQEQKQRSAAEVDGMVRRVWIGASA
jgi:hypothetical protein